MGAESAFEQIIRINEALRPEVGSMSSRRREGISTTEANVNHIELFEGKILLSLFFILLSRCYKHRRYRALKHLVSDLAKD